MNPAVTRLERKTAIESCIRSFIIKSIHAVVQARNGNTYSSNCISASGPRNNLMINIEEDPEIGAAIKHTFDSGFLVQVGDVFSLEILTSWSENHCMLVEVWQFRLDTEERLEQTCNNITSELSRLDLSANKPTGSDGVHSVEVVGEDSRLFEKLGTLLKTLVVVSRLLPAYELARGQGSSGYHMLYIIRRGVRDLKRLGSGSTHQLVGRLFSGLVMNNLPGGSVPTAGTTDIKPGATSDSANKVYLNVSVHYRTQVDLHTDIDLAPTPPVPATVSEVRHATKHSPRTSAAFANVNSKSRNEDEIDPAGEMLRGRISLEMRDELEDDYFSGGSNSDEDGMTGYNSPRLEADDTCALDCVCNRKTGTLGNVDSAEMDLQETNTATLANISSQAAFSNFTPSTTNQLGQLFLNLRRQANLNLFRVHPNSGSGASGGAANANVAGGQTQSSVFDAEALSDELERHEKTLKEFDDFIVAFCSVDAEVRPFAAPIQPR